MKKIGEVLKSEREKRNLTIQDVSNTLKIHPRFLISLEESNYKIFSNVIQIKGFIKNYSTFLNLDAKNIMAFWRREYDEMSSKDKLNLSLKPFRNEKFVFTPKFFGSFIATVLILVFFSYVYFQYRQFSKAPFITIESPSQDLEISKNSIEIFGRTDADSEILLNGQKIIKNPQGTFAVNVSLSEGINTLLFTAVNKLGRESFVTRKVLVAKRTDIESEEDIKKEEDSVEALEDYLKIELEVLEDASYIMVIKDSTKTFEGVVLLGVKLSFSAKNEIKINVGNAGVVKLYKDGIDIGILGEKGEVIEKIYTKPSK